MYTRFRLVPKSMTLNDLWARFKVIYSLNVEKMAKYSLVMTPTLCSVAGCIISIRLTYFCADHLLTYLLTYTVGSGSIKSAISPKRLKIERKLLLTAYIKSYTGFIAAKMCDLEWPLREIQGHWFLKCRKNGEIQLSYMTTTPCKVAGCIISVRLRT